IINNKNQVIKSKIINQTESMLSLEEKTLSDFIDFSSIMLQKFDKVSVIDGKLILVRVDRKLELEIKENTELVASVIEEKYSDYEGDGITLSELKELPVIDFEKQAELKDYIDDLVFALYFNVELDKIEFENAEKIKERCKKNRFYSVVESMV
ncbi:hypothetical protein J7L68_06575, partial [bacterium]|nr:hypothetical protein [bacterium]